MEPADYQPFPPEVHAYVDGRMSAEDERDFTRRLAASATLRSQVAQLRTALKLLRALPERQPPAGFEERVIGRIREEELAERARRRIHASRGPLWQKAVLAGAGAMAASLVLMLTGVFSSPEGTPTFNGTGGFDEVAAVPTEDDLLPVLCDHGERFACLRRNVAAASVAEPDLQRDLVRIELDASDLRRRQDWVAEQVSALPPERRIRYQNFLQGVDGALKVMDEELSREGASLDLARIQTSLLGVSTPEEVAGGYDFVARSSLRNSRTLISAGNLRPELQAYAALRAAEYRHDAHATREAAEAFLASWNSGEMADYARAALVSSLLRLNLDYQAAQQFDAEFSRHTRDWTPEQARLFKAYFTDGQKVRLAAALDRLPPG